MARRKKLLDKHYKGVRRVPKGFRTKTAKPVAHLYMITPAVAKEWLKCNTMNRSVTKMRVQGWGDQMKRGEWGAGADAIAFDIKGLLANGQHRLTACVETNTSFPCIIITGLHTEERANLDNGRSRDHADNLRMLRGVENAKRVKSVTMAVVRLLVPRGGLISMARVEEYIAMLGEGLRWVIAEFPGTRLPVTAPVAGALAFAYKKNPRKVKRICKQIKSLEFTDDSTKTLYKYLMEAVPTKKKDRGRVLALKTLRAIKSMIEGEDVEKLSASEQSFLFFLDAYTPKDLPVPLDSIKAYAANSHGKRRTAGGNKHVKYRTNAGGRIVPMPSRKKAKKPTKKPVKSKTAKRRAA